MCRPRVNIALSIGHRQSSCARQLGFMPAPEMHEPDHPELSKGNYLLNADGSDWEHRQSG